MKNNKGFSLVELIIVIAIMAVLVGVLAPTYLQYVEKSKKANDVSTIDTIVNAVEIASIDPVVVADADAPESINVVVTKDGFTISEAGSSWTTAVEDAIEGAKLKSFTEVEFTATRTPGSGKVSFTYTATESANSYANANAEFKTYASSLTKIS